MQDADRVAVVSTDTGLGTLNCGGSILGHRSLAEAYGTSGNTEVPYGVIQDVTGEWETGIGTYLGVSNALQRDTVKKSSTGGSKVNFPAGTKTIYIALSAESFQVMRASRATDTVLELRATSGQSANLLQSYDASGNAAMSIGPNGLVTLIRPSALVSMLDMPSNDTTGTVSVRRDLLGSPGLPGVRFRCSGSNATDGVVQISQGDSGYLEFRGANGSIQGLTGGGSKGVTFVEGGIKILNVSAQIDGSSAGHVAFDCEGDSGNTIWDFGPVNNAGSGTHYVRLGRYSGGNTKVELRVLSPGTTTSKAALNSDGWAKIGDYWIGASNDGVPGNYISRDNGAGVFFQSGVNSGTSFTFRDGDNATIALVSPGGSSIPSASTLLTREKADGRYTQTSSQRFKEEIEPADPGLAAKFNSLFPKTFIWGGELPESDERRGTRGLSFIAEEVVGPLPEAGCYIREDEDEETGEPGELVLQGLDPMPMIAVLHAKIAELETRLAAVERT